eukprot:UN05286
MIHESKFSIFIYYLTSKFMIHDFLMLYDITAMFNICEKWGIICINVKVMIEIHLIYHKKSPIIRIISNKG